MTEDVNAEANAETEPSPKTKVYNCQENLGAVSTCTNTPVLAPTKLKKVKPQEEQKENEKEPLEENV